MAGETIMKIVAISANQSIIIATGRLSGSADPLLGSMKPPTTQLWRSPAAVENLEGRRLLSKSSVALARATSDVVNAAVLPPRQVEKLDRGVVAVRTGSTTAYVGWRLLVDDASSTTFNLYRVTAGGAPSKRNSTPISASTNFADTGVSFTSTNQYYVRPIVNGVEGAASAGFTVEANVATRQYLNLPLQKPADTEVPNYASVGTTLPVTYSANDASVGDVDGDGQYEFIVKWDPSEAKDNAQSGYTGNVFIDAYKLDGTRLWRIDLGRNIRAGAHYTQFQVYDYDGDGKAEVAMRTAPGTIDGAGNNVLMGSDNPAADYRNANGYILSGPEYLTMFNGLTGAAMSTVAYDPPRGITTNNPTTAQINSIWGDNYGNRVDRFLAGTAYLDGIHPSLVMSRGYYTRAVIATYDFIDGQLVQRWKMDTNDSVAPQTAYRGQGAHSMEIADVDDDGRDEIIFGAATINDNGRGLYTTTLGHGDAVHVSDFIPSRPGLEIFMVHEDPGSYNKNGIDAGGEIHDARTGELLMTIPGGTADVGRGNAFDIDPRYAGAEYWSSASGQIWNPAAPGYDIDGSTVIEADEAQQIQSKPSNMFQNFGIQWDADPLYELLDGTTISDWRLSGSNYGRFNYIFAPAGVSSNNSTKSTPALAGDILGDWRDEVVWRASDSSALQIWTTTIAATTRQFTTMQDVQYREAIAWQNTGYNQPAHPSWFQGNGMATPPTPNVFFAGHASPEAPLLDAYQAEVATLSGGVIVESTSGGYEATGYVNFPSTGVGAIDWSNLATGGGGARTIRIRYALAGTTARAGSLIINGVSTAVTFAPTGSFNAWQTLSVGVDLSPYAPLSVRLESAGNDLPNVDELQLLRFADTIAPTASSSSFDYSGAVDVVRVQFSENVSASLAATDLVLTSGGSTLTATDFGFDAMTNIATFTLPALANGDWAATLNRLGVSDATGNLLAANAVVSFFVLAGDINRDRTVDFGDLVLLAQNYGTSDRAYGEGDLDGDGNIDFNDLVILAQNYGVSLPSNASVSVPTTIPIVKGAGKLRA
jgi:rhamnogalacturonan endolyase